MTITILAPLDGSTFVEKAHVLFYALLSDYCMNGRVDEPEGIVWSSDIDGEFARGSEVTFDCLCVGVHTVTVAWGDLCDDSITITITDNEDLDRP